MATLKQRWLDFIGRHLNPRTLAWAKSGGGPFSFVRHIGRKSGRVFETPIMVAQVPEGFVAELTYGPRVNWYRNIKAGGGELGHHGRTYRIVSVEDYPTAEGRSAYGFFPSLVLRLLRRKEFLLMRVEPKAADAPAQG